MKNTFLSLLRTPDDVKIQTDFSPLRYEEKGTPNPTDAQVQFEITQSSLKIILVPGKEPVRRLRLRFRGDLSGVLSILSDAWERASANHLIWKTFVPHEMLPWYFHTNDGARLHSYGVKTGANAFAFWQCDPKGITLILDVRNGSAGVHLKEPLLCAEVVCREGIEGESPFAAAKAFCKMMCEKPNLPETPVYGFNNWYWAYGNTDQKTFVGEAKYLGSLARDCAVRPYMVMDDGWEISRTKGYNGGPWTGCNERFSSMAETAAQVREAGCRPGVWFRPLRTMGHVPEEAIFPSPCNIAAMGVVIDPTHPFTLERIARDTDRIAGWGYELIKHDFTTLDLFDRWIDEDRAYPFFDNTLTNAQIFKNIYQTIQDNARGGIVIGCNTVGHLTAGIHQIQRIGDDTSGRSFEWTRRDGIHSMMRLPQAGTFSQIDPDCAAFTERVSAGVNLDFMEAMAITGSTVFASVTPGILTAREEARAAEILKIAASITPGEYAEPLDWHRTSAPAEYLFRGKEYRYDWYSEYEGVRNTLTWTN